MHVPVQSPQRICFRDFKLDLTSGEFHKDGQKVPLAPRAFEVLRCLVEHPGEVVTREDLRARLWAADTFVEFDDSLNHAVNMASSQGTPTMRTRIFTSCQIPHRPSIAVAGTSSQIEQQPSKQGKNQDLRIQSKEVQCEASYL